MENIIKKLIGYLEKNIGTGSLILVGVFIIKLCDKNFIKNLPLVNTFAISHIQSESCITLITLITSIFIFKFAIQIGMNYKNLYFQEDKFLANTAKKIVILGWAFLIINILDKEFSFDELISRNSGIFEYIYVFTLSMYVLFLFGASIKGIFSEID